MGGSLTSRNFTLAVNGYGKAVSTAAAAVRLYDSRARLGRAIKGLGVCWALGVGFVFIPVAHFILVPGAGMTGVVVFLRRLGQRSEVIGLNGTCPDCGHEQSFDVRGTWTPPFAVNCRSCARGLTLSV